MPTGGSLTAKEVFGEVRVPLLADTAFFEELTLNGAFRYSDYNLDGVGGVWTYLGGAEWRPTRDIALPRPVSARDPRAQRRRAVRRHSAAASIPRPIPARIARPAAQRTAAVRAVCVATGVPAALVFTAGIQPNTIIPADFGGNPNVGEEKSDTYTAGVVLDAALPSRPAPQRRLFRHHAGRRDRASSAAA